MDPRTNPYAPGAGTPPPELAGRDSLIQDASIALDRIRAGRASRSIVLYGLRGVGKTVLLNRFRLDAEANGFESIQIEAPESRSLPAILGPAARATLIRLSQREAAKALAERALSSLAGFIKSMKRKYGDIEMGLDIAPTAGLADSGDLDVDLTALIRSVGEAAKAGQTAVVIYIDELQYISEDQLGSLITALHAASQMQLPITMMAAGLPQLLGQMGRAKSYAERLFSFARIDRLERSAAIDALCIPARKEGAELSEGAIEEILEQTLGYPYFLQEWGKHSWNVADTSPIEPEDAAKATVNALAELDASFFRVRFDRLTPAEKNYVRAMAELGEGPHRSGDIADALGRKVTSVAPIRNSLITKGMLYAPSHGDTAFTVPLFDGFLKRTMPLMS